MQLRSVRFENYKLLRDTTLPLEPLTVIVGPNDSGKSSVLQALSQIAHNDGLGFAQARTYDVPHTAGPALELTVTGEHRHGLTYSASGGWNIEQQGSTFAGDFGREFAVAQRMVQSFRAFTLVASRMRAPGVLTPEAALDPDGSNLAVVLDRLRDRDDERFEALNRELARWVPSFDRVTFETPEKGMRGVVLRARATGARISAPQLSDGTLLALGLLTIAYAEDEHQVVGIEEPEVGLHPRLMRLVRDALLRIAYPEQNGIDRPARQVIVTTHSPYFLDQFRDLPENVVVAERHARDATFHRLADREDVDEILAAGPLGEAWFTGVLGGVPVGT